MNKHDELDPLAELEKTEKEYLDSLKRIHRYQEMLYLIFEIAHESNVSLRMKLGVELIDKLKQLTESYEQSN